jgi:hypothetical protein
MLYRLFTLGVNDVSPQALKLDHKIGHICPWSAFPPPFCCTATSDSFSVHQGESVVGQRPHAHHLHPVGGGLRDRAVRSQLHGLSWVRQQRIGMRCLDVMGMFLFYALVVDAAVEGLDLIHRTYEAEESFQVLYQWRMRNFFTPCGSGRSPSARSCR